MKINKRELLKRLTQEDLWKKLSSEEIRLYLLLVVFADEVEGTGKLSLQVFEGCLGSSFLRDQLEEAAHNLEKLHLVQINISSSGSEIRFEFLERR